MFYTGLCLIKIRKGIMLPGKQFSEGLRVLRTLKVFAIVTLHGSRKCQLSRKKKKKNHLNLSFNFTNFRRNPLHKAYKMLVFRHEKEKLFPLLHKIIQIMKGFSSQFVKM